MYALMLFLGTQLGAVVAFVFLAILQIGSRGDQPGPAEPPLPKLPEPCDEPSQSCSATVTTS